MKNSHRRSGGVQFGQRDLKRPGSRSRPFAMTVID